MGGGQNFYKNILSTQTMTISILPSIPIIEPKLTGEISMIEIIKEGSKTTQSYQRTKSDSEKAFDTVPHSLLWLKLIKLGLSPRFIDLIKNY
ncbi:hypothetical protein LAZ67_8001251 [Cordylochernes scorpioides]|uniref:Reverse transcriptase domain-containing protein n=1 Tax=Cordylochernes scorpioides TaxID=51811 RepID=A0ABY6KQ17_9ARAC|nr:hypothetical protein LAZ67_8001251 [Cordylochernes scorpioides]